MGNGKLIVAILFVILLIAALVGGYYYVQTNNMQAKILQDEMSVLMEQKLIEDDIDMEIKSSGNYAKVEEAVKEYLNNVKNLYTKVSTYGGDAEISSILSAENIAADPEGLTVVDQKLEEYKQNLQNLISQASMITNEATIMQGIEGKDLKDSYKDVYKNIMLNDAMQEKLSSAETKIEAHKEKAEEKLENLEKVAKFLQTNAKYWDINDGKIQFTNVNKLAEYYQLLNGAQ